MRTAEKIKEKIQEMMDEEHKKFEECAASSKWWENMGDTENANYMKTNAIKHLRGFTQLYNLLEWINEK